MIFPTGTIGGEIRPSMVSSLPLDDLVHVIHVGFAKANKFSLQAYYFQRPGCGKAPREIGCRTQPGSKYGWGAPSDPIPEESCQSKERGRKILHRSPKVSRLRDNRRAGCGAIQLFLREAWRIRSGCHFWRLLALTFITPLWLATMSPRFTAK